MPLLLCPNDNGPMTSVERAGVQFDMCPTCRGVWLDRGELEKLMAAAAQDAAGTAPDLARAYPPQQTRPPQQPWQAYGERGEHGHYGHGGYRKKRSIFDIFD